MDASSAATMAAAETPRRLYEHGFEGWDVSQACYATDYLVMAVGISFALVAYDKVRRASFWDSLWGLMFQFAIFSLMQGVGSGFRGIAHHLLATYREEGYVMGRHWGAPHAEWLFAWLMALVILPLASASCLGTSLAYGEFGVGWIKVVKGLGALVAVFEVYLCLSDQIDSSGAITVYWAVIVSSLACFAVFRRGIKVPGLWMIALGNALRVIGYAVLISVPAGCKRPGMYRVDCPYPVEFNHNAVYHVFIAASVVAIYFGVNEKYTKDQQDQYWSGLQSLPQTERKERVCGLGW